MRACRNILATNQIAKRTIEPFENNNKRSQGRLGEGGPLSSKPMWDTNQQIFGPKMSLANQWIFRPE